MSATADRYDRTTILLHWLTAGLVLWQWVQAHLIDMITTGGTPARRAMIGLHILGGLALLGVLAFRIYWRHGRGTRLAAEPGPAGLLSRAVHIALYLLLAFVLGWGIWLVWVRGDNIFGILQIPAFDPGNRALRRSQKEIHETLANALLVLAGLHALKALAFHYIRHDRVLRRMLPRRG